MTLRCRTEGCIGLAHDYQLSFYNESKGVWHLGLKPHFLPSHPKFPSTICLVQVNDFKCPYDVICDRCKVKIGSVGKIPGFEKFTVNFSSQKVVLQLKGEYVSSKSEMKSWSKVVELFPKINRIEAPTTTDKVNVQNEAGIGECIMAAPFDSLTGFHFENSTNVGLNRNFIWNENVTLEVYDEQIFITQRSCRFCIQNDEIDGAILINSTDDSYSIFICLKKPPRSLRNNERIAFDFNGRSFNLCVKRNTHFDGKTSRQLQQALQSFNMQVFKVALLIQKYSEREPIQKQNIIDDEEGFFRFLVIRAWHNKYASLLPPRLPGHILEELNSCPSLDELQRRLDATIPTRFQELKIANSQPIELPFQVEELPSNYAMFGRVKVTPSRFIFLSLAPVMKNRIFRFYPDPSNFLLVSFVDEHDGDPWRWPSIAESFLAVLYDGIMVGDKRFTFLGCSNSQLRIGHCWFSCLDRQSVYNKIGHFPENWTAGRKLSRLALAFAASIETISLDHGRYLKNVAPDIENGPICFSDGIGRGSLELFNQVQRHLHLSEQPSALQIRIGGIKGVISRFNQLEDVTFRKSMKKFESDHNKLEILNYSQSLPMTLSRHVILLLSSFHVPDEIFLELQYAELMKSLDALIHDEQSIKFVKCRSKVFSWESLPTSQVVQEPLFRQMLTSNAIELLTNLVDRANIPLEKGRVLMGVLDETNTLNYGEVYAHIIEDDVDFELNGTVLVYRNPCVLPSDVRVLNARTVNLSPNFKFLYRNCLVIPAHGPDSHARECSGGDLDGDLYYVIWDQRLIPAALLIPGLPVVEVETREMILSSGGNSELDMMKFFCDFVANNQLGVIANAHLATSDQLGMCHPKSVELAKYVTAETDAPKKGLTVGKVRADLLPAEYPDYMRKDHKPSYRSNTILGQLFRQALPLLEILQEKELSFSQPSLNHQNDDKDIESFYQQYSFEIKRLMQCLDVQTEVDLFSGTPIWRRGYKNFIKQQTQLREKVTDKATEFWVKWTKAFETWRDTIGNDQTLITNWYQRPKISHSPFHSFSFLALPYLRLAKSQRKQVTELIKESTSQWIVSNKDKWTDEWSKRFNAGVRIMQTLEGNECHFYGSSMLGLSEQHSDIDIFAADFDLQKLSKALKGIDENVKRIEKPHMHVTLTVDSKEVEVTNFTDGVKKSYALAEVFDENPGLWPALRVLLEWARIVRIVKSDGVVNGLMNVISFCHLFVSAVTTSPYRLATQQKPYSLERLNKWIASTNSSTCGEFISKFLAMFSIAENKVWIASKTDPLNGRPLIKRINIDQLCRTANFAHFILAVHDGDIQKLFQLCSNKRIYRIDKTYMRPGVPNIVKNRKMLEIQAMCNPNHDQNVILELRSGNGSLYLEVTGHYKDFVRVEQALGSIESKTNTSTYHFDVYHFINASIIIPELGRGSSTEVSFVPFQSDRHHPVHTANEKSSLRLKGDQLNQTWWLNEFERYEQRFTAQLEMIKEKSMESDEASWWFKGEITCTIKCGSHYFIESSNATELVIHQVEKNISRPPKPQGHQQTKITHYKENRSKRQHKFVPSQDPLGLIPLHNSDMRFGERRKQFKLTPKENDKEHLKSIQDSFYPCWRYDLGKVKQLAKDIEFQEAPIESKDYCVKLFINWKDEEAVIICDRDGMIRELRPRTMRWVSATFIRFDDRAGEDVSMCLETANVIDNVEGLEIPRSIFCDDFDVHQDEPTAVAVFNTQLLETECRPKSIRRLTPIVKYSNTDNDTIILYEIQDATFDAELQQLKWLPKYQELNINLCVERDEGELCQKSYEIAQQLFKAAQQ